VLVSSRAASAGGSGAVRCPRSVSVSIFKVYFAQVRREPTRLPHLVATEDAAPFPFQFLSGKVILLCHPQAAATLPENVCCLPGEPVIKCEIGGEEPLVSSALISTAFGFLKPSCSGVLFKLHF